MSKLQQYRIKYNYKMKQSQIIVWLLHFLLDFGELIWYYLTLWYIFIFLASGIDQRPLDHKEVQ